MLDETEGACLVYAHRPAACRTYGFYVRRADGLHCEIVECEALAHGEGAFDGDARGPMIVWGNHESVEHTLLRLSGVPRSLTAWVREAAEAAPARAR